MYSRTLDDGSPEGRVLTFAASGWTWHFIFILQDLETGSLWFPGLNFNGGLSQFLLCISGELQDMTVPAVESSRTVWKPWRQANPSTMIMQVK